MTLRVHYGYSEHTLVGCTLVIVVHYWIERVHLITSTVVLDALQMAVD